MTTRLITDLTAHDQRVIFRVLAGSYLTLLVVAGLFAARYIAAHTFAAFASTLLCLAAAWWVAGPLEDIRHAEVTS